MKVRIHTVRAENRCGALEAGKEPGGRGLGVEVGRWRGLPRPRASPSRRQGSLRLRPLIVAPAAQRLTPPALLPGRKVRDAERESACGRGTPGQGSEED